MRDVTRYIVIRCPTTGKVVYPTQYHAERAKATIAKRSARERVPIAVYRCPECEWWHLTSHGPEHQAKLAG